jgi:peptidoglycan-associated lipoprotein
MTRSRLIVSVLTLSAAVAVAAAGCHKRVPPQVANGPVSGDIGGSGATTSPPAPPFPASRPSMVDSARDANAQEAFGRKSLAELNAERPLSDVFFDLDTQTIRDDAKALLVANANWARTWESTMLTIEGYCDERGSSEYNLALGSRRADAVKSYLVGLGVSASRIALVSKGKEQGFCSDDNEGCWQQNRRGHFLITAK